MTSQTTDAETLENAIISCDLLVGSQSRRLEEKNGHCGGLIFDFLHKIDVICITFLKNGTTIFHVAVPKAATFIFEICVQNFLPKTAQKRSNIHNSPN